MKYGYLTGSSVSETYETKICSYLTDLLILAYRGLYQRVVTGPQLILSYLKH